MNIAGIIAVSVFVIAALVLLAPGIWDALRDRRYHGPLVVGQIDWLWLFTGIIGAWMMSLAIGLTFWNGVLLYAGLFVYQTRGKY